MIDEAHLRVGVQHRVIWIDSLGSSERALAASSCCATLLLLLPLLRPDLGLPILRLRSHSLMLPRAISRPLVVVSAAASAGLLLVELVLRGVRGVQLMRRSVGMGVGDGVLVGVVEHRVGFLRVVFLFCTESI